MNRLAARTNIGHRISDKIYRIAKDVRAMSKPCDMSWISHHDCRHISFISKARLMSCSGNAHDAAAFSKPNSRKIAVTSATALRTSCKAT
jgi:hypothetical protein